MRKEIGRWTQKDGSIRVHSEEPIAGDFGQRQIFETLGADGLPLAQEISSEPTLAETPAGIAEFTPGQVILHIAVTYPDGSAHINTFNSVE